MNSVTNEMASTNAEMKHFEELHATLIGKIPDGDFDVLSGVHAGFLFNIINYRVVCLRDVHSVLFVTNAYQKDQVQKLVECGIFDAAIIWDGSVGFTASSIKTEADILAYFDSLMNKAGLELGRIDKAFLFSDNNDQMGAYLDIRSVDVVPVETAIGAFGWKWRYESFHNEGKISEDLYRMQKEHCILCGENKKHRITANDNRIYSSESFDNGHSIEKMSNIDKKKIVSCFHDPSFYIGKTVVLLNSTGYLSRGGINKEGCKIFLRVIKRYFCPANKDVIVKLHPYSYPASCFSIEGIQVLEGKENIDVIAYTDYRISCAIDFESTSIEKIANNTENVKHLGLPAYSQSRYYPIAEFMKKVCEESKIGFSQNIISDVSWKQSSLAESEDSWAYSVLKLSFDSGKIIAKCISDFHYKPVREGRFKITVSSDGCVPYSVCLSLYTDSDELWNRMLSSKTDVFGDLKIQSQKLPSNKILMGTVAKKKVRGRTRLVCPVKITNDEGSKEEEAYFEVTNEYESSLDDDVSDSFVFAAIFYAMVNDCNICCETPVSVRFKHMIEDAFVPTIVNSGSIDLPLHNVEIIADCIEHRTNGICIGTEIPGGVESVYSCEKYARRTDPYKLTHILIVHWGDWLDDSESFRECDICGYLGTKLVNVGTNVSKIFRTGLMAYEYWIMASALATRRMWKEYLCPSMFPYYTGVDSKSFDSFQALAAACLSGDGFSLCYEGGDISFLQKIKDVARSNLARKYLSVCSNGKFSNCSWCSKCIRTMIGLDLCGALDEFSKVFNVDEYRKETDKYVHYAVLHKKEPLFEEIHDELCLKYPEMIENAYRVNLPEGKADDLSKLTLYYSELPDHPYSRFRLALMYRDGKSVSADPEKYMAILDELYEKYPGIHDDVLNERVIALKKKGEYDKILEMYRKHPNKPFIKIEVARMYRDGRVLPKDIDKAMALMLEAADSGNVVASNEYASIVIDNRIASRYEDAYNRCIRYAKHRDSCAQFRIAKMYELGIYVPKDLNSALSWMRRSNNNGFPPAKSALTALESKMKSNTSK
jgi:hypothetical protein